MLPLAAAVHCTVRARLEETLREALMRRWAIGLLGATLIGVVLLGIEGNPHPAAAQQDERLAVVSGYFDATARGDVDEALSAFTDDAVFIGVGGGGCPRQAPFTDLAENRRQIEGNPAIPPRQTIRNVEVSGTIVLGQLEARADNRRARGVERELRSFIAEIPNDKITFFAVVNDLSDPLTAFSVAVAAGTEAPRAPLPNPATPCAGV